MQRALPRLGHWYEWDVLRTSGTGLAGYRCRNFGGRSIAHQGTSMRAGGHTEVSAICAQRLASMAATIKMNGVEGASRLVTSPARETPRTDNTDTHTRTLSPETS